MQQFYEQVLSDDVIGYIFTDVAKLDLEHHLPIICDFWESMLFKSGDYARHGRNPMTVHFELNNKEQLKTEHFVRWLKIFNATVDANFEGNYAEQIKQRAIFIGDRIQNYLNRVPQIRRPD